MRVGSRRGKRRAVSLLLVLLLAHLLLFLLLLLLLRPNHLPPAAATAGEAAAATAPAPSAAPPSTRLLGNPRARASPCVGVGTGKTWAWQPVYTVVVDAGDTATRAHVFSFLRCCLDNTFLLQKEHYFQVNDTVLNYVTAPHQMRWLLLPLLRRARTVVPQHYLPYTPLLLRATPSLRRLPRVYATRLIYRARKIVSRTSFLVKREEVTIMAGHDEAADLWLAANFLTGRLYQNDSVPMATANLGGGTLQVTIPLPGPPEHIRRAISERRKARRKEEGESQGAGSGGHHGGGVRRGSGKDQGVGQGTEGVDPATGVSKSIRRWRTSDKEASDSRKSEGSGGAGGIRTRGRGRGGVRGGHSVHTGNESEKSESHHVQIGAQRPVTTSTTKTGLRDVFKEADLRRVQGSGGAAETPQRGPKRKKNRKRFRDPNTRPRNRTITPGKHVNNSFVVVPQSGSDASGAGGKIFVERNDGNDGEIRTQEEGSADGSRGGPRRRGRKNEESRRGREDSGGKRGVKHETQEDKIKGAHSGLSNNGRRNGRSDEKQGEENKRRETTEESHKREEKTNSYVENNESSSHNLAGNVGPQRASQRDTLDTPTQNSEDTAISTHSHASNPRERVAPGGSRGTGPRVTRPPSRSYTLRPPRRRIHPKRQRKRNQKKPTRRKGVRRSNGIITQNNQQTVSGLYRRQQAPVTPLMPPSPPSKELPLPAGGQKVHPGSVWDNLGLPTVNASPSTASTAHDREHSQSQNHTNTSLQTHSSEEPRHDNRQSPNDTKTEVNVTRRRNTETREGGARSINSDSRPTQRVKAPVSEASQNSTVSEVVKSFPPNKAVNESVASSRSEIDKRGEEGGEGGGAGGSVTSHPGREINEKGTKNGRNMTAEVKHDTKETSGTTNGKYIRRKRRRRRRRRERRKIFRNDARQRVMSLQAKRLEQQRNIMHNRESVTRKDFSSSAGLLAFQNEDVTHFSTTQSVEESVKDGTDGDVIASRSAGSGTTEDFLAPEINGNSRSNNSRRQDATRLSRRADLPVSGSRAATRPGVTTSGREGRKIQFQPISRRDRKRQAKKYVGTQPEPDTSLRDAAIHVSAPDADNQSQDKYQEYNSGIFQEGQAQAPHHQRHYHSRRRRHRRRRRRRRRRHHHRYQGKENDRGRRSVGEGRHNAFYGLNRLLPPGEGRKSAKWRKNDQRNRKELADPFLVPGDWRESLRRSYFGTLFLGLNNRERWQRLKPRAHPKKPLNSAAVDSRFSAGSEKTATPPPRIKIRGSSGEESQKSFRFLRRRRSVSKFAQETKAKMKTKRQNLRADLSQRCGRTSAGLLRSCGEPEMNCKPGKGDPRQAEIVHGSCDGFGLGANQSSSAEQEPPPGKDRGPRGYVEQGEDTALVMVSDAGGDDGGGFQRRRRELRNLSKTPNVTYRCSPSHKYWLFASSMPMGLYPLRVQILQSGNITRLVPTSDEEEALGPHEITSEAAPTTLAPPAPATTHHRSDIPPEEEYIGMNELESPDTYSGTLSTPSSIPSSRPPPTISSSVPSTTPSLPTPPRPPYITVRVTNKWVEETLAKVKTVVDSILKSIGSARSNLDEKSHKKVPDRDVASKGGEGEAKESKAERRKEAKGGYEEERGGSSRNGGRERGKESNNEDQGRVRDERERGTRREGIEIGKLDKKRWRERNRKGKSKGNRRLMEGRESQITLESSADQEADDREGERNGRGENTESLWNKRNNRERRKHHTRRRSGVIRTAENNKSFPNVERKREKSDASNNKVKQESSRVSGAWKAKLSVATSTPASPGFEGSSAEKESVPGALAEREGSGRKRRERGKTSAIDSEEFREGRKGFSVPLPPVSREEGVAGHRRGRRERDNSDIVHSTGGSKDSTNDNVFIPKRYSVLDSEEAVAGSREKFLPRVNNVDSGNENVVGGFSTKISSNVDSGKNGNEAGSGSGVPAPKQTISSVTDLLFTVPNERVIRPALNSQVQSEIKSTEKLIRTSLEDLLFRIPPVGSRQTHEEGPGLKTPGETGLTDTTTTTAPDTTALPRELASPDDTVAPSVDTNTNTVTGRKSVYREGLKKRKKEGEVARGEVPHDTVYQRKNDTENRTKKAKTLENEEETEAESQEETGDLILRTACLPVGSIGRFKVEGVTYLVTGMGAGAGAEDCWREVTNVVNRHIRLPALNHTTLLATTAFYFVAASANLIEPEMTYGFVRVEQFRLAANVMCAREPRFLPDPLACLDYQYVAALLTQGLHLSDDTEILVCDKIQGFRVGWALGAALDYLQNH